MMQILYKVYREFGPVGIASFVGGVILLYRFSTELDIIRQCLFGLVGLILIGYSIYIAYFRLKIQKDRESALITMAENSCNRLAEQLGKNLSDHQIDAIVQKIRQTQSQLIAAISDK